MERVRKEYIALYERLTARIKQPRWFNSNASSTAVCT